MYLGERKIQESMPGRLETTTRFVIPDDHLRLTEHFFSLEGEGILMGAPCYLVRFAGCNLRCRWCTPGGSLVTMAGGRARRIDEVKVGEQVLSWRANALVVGRVEEVLVHRVNSNELLTVVLASGKKLFVTKEHPFWVKGRWVPAAELQAGSELLNLLPGQVASFQKRRDNPMFVKEVVIRGRETLARNLQTGRTAPWKRTAAERQLYSERMRGDKNPMRSPGAAAKSWSRRQHHPSKLEQWVAGVAQEQAISLRYVGDGKLWIGDKGTRLLNPDFVVPGQRKVVEVFDPTLPVLRHGKFQPRGTSSMRRRLSHYHSFGYKALAIPATSFDLTQSGKQRIGGRLRTFAMNGDRVVSVRSSTVFELRRLGSRGRERRSGIRRAKDSINVYNLRCSTHNYFLNGVLSHNCDSKFAAWYDQDFEVVHWKTILDIVSSLPGFVSYTGGEPLFRRENELRALTQLIQVLRGGGHAQKMETSGTVDPPDWFPSEALFWSIAPKTAGMGTGTFLDPQLLQHILTHHVTPRRAHIKFVIGARKQDGTIERDFAAVKELLGAVPVLDQYPIVFQPEGLTESTPEYIERCVLLWEAIQKDPEIMAIPNWRALPQLHQIYWRNERRR